MKRLLFILCGIAFSQIEAIRFEDCSYGYGSETSIEQTLDGYRIKPAPRDTFSYTPDDYDGFWGKKRILYGTVANSSVNTWSKKQ